MITRTKLQLVRARLSQFPAVVLLGPRQIGKTTLAHQVAEARQSVYLDLENTSDQAKLSDPILFLSFHEDKLVILDEIQRTPGLFETLRGQIDVGRRGLRSNSFLLLGSASMNLLRQSGESLASRIAYVELEPLSVLEVDAEAAESLWVRGGFPDSYLASSDTESNVWRENFIRTYLERDVPQLGSRVPAATLRRFWTMLCHRQGSVLNAAELARSLGVDGKTVASYLDLLVNLLLVRRLPPLHANVGKRLVKSPKVYLRDSGLVHALLGLVDRDAILSHPVAGASWEGFVIENLLRATPDSVTAYFYRTVVGAEIDLVLQLANRELWAIEVKRSLAPKLDRGFFHARQDLRPTRSFIVYLGTERYPIGDDVEVINVVELALLLQKT